MTDFTPDRLQELRRIAEAATPGPWTSPWEQKDGLDPEEYGFYGASGDKIVGLLWYDGWHLECSEENARHIATFDPPTVLAMLDEIERLRREISVQQTTLENLRSALVAEGHEPGCPVVWGHSVDCVPGTCIETRTYRATYGEKGGGE